VGFGVGTTVGSGDGNGKGSSVGTSVGCGDGNGVGRAVGSCEGNEDIEGCGEGTALKSPPMTVSLPRFAQTFPALFAVPVI
jgi:hypothetical protein